MGVPINPFKKALQNGQFQIGFWQALMSPISVEICAGAGFDWLLLDGEHGPNDVPSQLAQLQAAAAFPVHPIGRLPIGDVAIIKQYLDIGFTTLLVPIVETGEHAALLARAVRYPPAGIRGVGSSIVRASNYNRMSGYLDEADAQICLLVQVETRRGIENLEAIAGTEGVDGVFIGPADLSAALGHRGNPTHPEVLKTIEDAFHVIKRAGKAAGILMADEALARHYIELGFTFLAVGSDVGLMVKATSDLARKYKSGAPAASPAKTGDIY
jgi:4-hydroxy-2-oxoheptanedioate aldolase